MLNLVNYVTYRLVIVETKDFIATQFYRRPCSETLYGKYENFYDYEFLEIPAS